MKTKLGDYYIALNCVQAIGPMRIGGNEMMNDPQRRYGFTAYLANCYGGSIWLDAAPDILDKFNLDSSANDAIKAKAKLAYDAFVAEWKGVS